MVGSFRKCKQYFMSEPPAQFADVSPCMKFRPKVHYWRLMMKALLPPLSHSCTNSLSSLSASVSGGCALHNWQVASTPLDGNNLGYGHLCRATQGVITHGLTMNPELQEATGNAKSTTVSNMDGAGVHVLHAPIQNLQRRCVVCRALGISAGLPGLQAWAQLKRPTRADQAGFEPATPVFPPRLPEDYF